MATTVTSDQLKNERLKRGLNSTQFADFLEINRSFYSRIERGAAISETTAAKILLKLKQKEPSPKATEKNPDREAEPNYIFLNKQSVQELIEKGSSENSAIPYLDLDIMTIPIKQIVQRTFIPSFRVQLPGFMDSTMMIPVYGESNAAFFSPGTLIICKEIHDHKKLVMGDTYLIFTEEHRFIRRILSQNKEWVTTSTVPKGTKDSHGKVYDGILQEIPLADLLLVFSIQGHVVRDQI